MSQEKGYKRRGIREEVIREERNGYKKRRGYTRREGTMAVIAPAGVEEAALLLLDGSLAFSILLLAETEGDDFGACG